MGNVQPSLDRKTIHDKGLSRDVEDGARRCQESRFWAVLRDMNVHVA